METADFLPLKWNILTIFLKNDILKIENQGR